MGAEGVRQEGGAHGPEGPAQVDQIEPDKAGRAEEQTRIAIELLMTAISGR